MHGKITAKYMQDDEFQYIFFAMWKKNAIFAFALLNGKQKI